MSPRQRDDNDDDEDAFLAKTAREARQVEQRDRQTERRLNLGDLMGGVIPISLAVVVAGGIWGVAIAFSNYNNRIDQQQREIDRLGRRVVYTTEWRSWAEVVRLQNPSVTIPDPKDYTSDRTE